MLLAGPSARLRRRWRQGLGRRVGVYEVAEQAELEQALADLRPAILILDMALYHPGGIRDVPVLRRLSPSTKIVLLANKPHEREGIAALKAGVRGYCDRHVASPLLRKAVERVQQGEIWIGRKIIARLLDDLTSLTEQRRNELGPIQNSTENPERRLASLTPREREIAQLLSGGVSNKEIASRLHLTEKTVKAHLTGIFRKLGLSSRLQVALLAASQSLSNQIQN